MIRYCKNGDDQTGVKDQKVKKVELIATRLWRITLMLDYPKLQLNQN